MHYLTAYEIIGLESRERKNMNLTEIKNATKRDLLEHLESWGVRVYPDSSVKELREDAQDLYWKHTDNEGYYHISVEENY